jgi:hypothetical protein
MKKETGRDNYEAPKIKAYGTMQSIVSASGSPGDGSDPDRGDDFRVDANSANTKTTGDDFRASNAR